jgi:hypothetical protein
MRLAVFEKGALGDFDINQSSNPVASSELCRDKTPDLTRSDNLWEVATSKQR